MAIDLGKAYVQIVPSAKGISGSISKALGPESKVAGESSGKSIGGSIISTLKKVVIAAGIGKIISSSITEGANLEQSLGGVETLFKESADTVIKYANGAYKTAGVSANDYMENVTSFSASLLQSLGGDTKKAAEVAHTAMVDMSDNANKMGTNMQDIQNAYQGFAKQNYTMLDNLKLGYGGTKSEMERLLADAQKLSGVKYDINNLSDVYEAIHVIQEEIGITGTTALEAEETFSGSLNAMKASLQNVLGAIAIGGDVTSALQGLTETIIIFVSNNLLPMLTNILTQLPTMLVELFSSLAPQLIQAGADAIVSFATGLAESLPTLIPQAIEAIITVVNTLIENLPMLVDAALQLIIGFTQGLIAALPVIIEALPEIIIGIVDFLLDSIPQIIQAGIDLLTALVEALPEIISAIVAAIPKIIDGLIVAILNSIPQIIQAGVDLLIALVENLPTIISTIVQAIPEIITGIVNALTNNIPLIVEAGVTLLTAIITNLPLIIWEIVKAMPQIITGIVNGLMSGIGSIVEVGANLVRGLWEGIKSLGSWIWDKVTGWASNIWSGIKGVFGIKSPSTEMAWVGEMLNEGLAKGITDNLNPVEKAMGVLGDATTKSFEADLALNAAASMGSVSSLNTAINSGIANNNASQKDNQPVALTLNIGGQSWTAFIDNITKQQDRNLDLALTYAGG